MTTGELVHLDVAGGVATLTLDSPPNRNALSAALMTQLLEGLDRSLADDAVRVLVLSHTGRVFCSGADLSESQRADGDIPVATLPAVLQRIWESPKPVVARVGGAARAGGVGLVAACDIAVAAESASFAFTEVRLGVVPAVISVPVLPRLAARPAAELFLTGEVFDAGRAAAIGLVNAVVPDDGLDAEVARYAGLLVRGAPAALAATKALLRRRPGASMADDFAAMSALSVRHFTGDEGREGIAAYREKRDPAWVPPAD